MSYSSATDTYNRLDALWGGTSVPQARIEGTRYVIISDVHLGNGGQADNLRHNRDILMAATAYYLGQEYVLILAGDTEDFWQFGLEEIKGAYESSVYARFKEFARVNRLIRIFGNHDREWGPMPDPAFNNSRCQGCQEGQKLLGSDNVPRILIVHGHQGDPMSDKGSWFSRFFVHLYRYLEPLTHLLTDDPAATMSDISKDYERMMYGWAKANQVLLICGHSHRAVAASVSYADILEGQKADLKSQMQTALTANQPDVALRLNQIDAALSHEKKRGRDFTRVEDSGIPIPCYFNSGCCCYQDGLTAIEIADDQIALVKWCPGRTTLQSMPLTACLTSIKSLTPAPLSSAVSG
jgi:UDP-2,3-diacylglucosamine pyrophosphatase LpxH